MKIKGYALAAISAISYGLIPLFILPVKASHFSLDTTLFYRFFISALFLLGYLVYKKESLRVNRSEFMILAILGLFYALSAEFLFLGYDYLSPGIASTILFVYPVIVALVMTFFFKEKITGLTVLSLIITIGGIIALSAKDGALNINLTGLLITLLSATFYALYMVVVNKAKIAASGFKITFYSLVFSAVFYLGKTLLLKESLAIPNVAVFFNFTAFAFVTTVLSMSSLVYAIKTIGSTPTSILGALEPVVAVAISVMLFHESLSLSLIIGIAFILTGVMINIISERAKEKVAQPDLPL
ncbi:DMT family transporter [Pedobacter sp. PLR]|uniref:DMT family transporter n=1 Tax=Pedobacter sp. PLR TaxID=2994465 RepID=UPI00224842A4|nr:DMT family transporter [Pedobacter sp. PLR]MCX2449779.1 DMT family transporter [Pedobacter sp. PLR]